MRSTSYPLSAKYFRESKTSVALRFEYSFYSIAEISLLSIINVLYYCALFFVLDFPVFLLLISESSVAELGCWWGGMGERKY